MAVPKQIVLLICTIFLVFSDAAKKVKWCHEKSDSKLCKEIATKYSDVQCVPADSIYRCMQMVKAGKDANVLYVRGDEELYPAGKHGLKLLFKVVPSNSDSLYKAVAVVKRGGKVKKLADLKNAMSCHTYAGETASWITPVANLIQMNIMPTKDCYSSTVNLGNFFMGSCAPRAMTERYNPLKNTPPRLCSLCSATEPCSPEDPNSGSKGVERCLELAKADIAFVKHETMLTFNRTSYRLLCPDDKLMELSQYKECNWAVRPNDAIFVSPVASNTDEIADLIKDYTWPNGSLEKTNKDYTAIMDKGFKNTFEYYHNCKISLRWCAVGDLELKKCTDLTLAFMAKHATSKLECVKGKDHHDCMAMIEQKKADFMVLDGGDLEIAINDCKLEPVIAEDYGVETASYYTVAVAKKSTKFNIKQLKGKNSCHTGIGKTSGWKSPISYLIQNKMIKTGHSIAEEVGKFFNASCVPGALLPEYNPDGHNPESLCALCPKDSKCARDSSNKYYGYTGAFHCLVEVGDVAFVKHTTVMESTDGHGKDAWENNLKKEDYQLLCKDGSRKPVTDWKECHIAKVPAHAMVVRKNEPGLGRLLFQIFNNFNLASNTSKELLFSSPGGNNLLFKDSTTGLIRITEPNKFLGKDYLEILKVFASKTKVCSASSRSTISVILVLFTLVNYFA